MVRLVRSSSQSGGVDEYGEQQMLYERSPNNSRSVVYDRNAYTMEENASGAGLLTEEMLLRSHANNGGKFPTHLLSKLGSQIYDMPSEQVDMSGTNRRSTTTTRYYTANQGETGYESTGDDGGGVGQATASSGGFGEEKYVQIKSSDLKNVLANYDLYSSTGQKLEGEQLTF